MGAIFTNIAEIFAKSGWAQIFFTEGGWKYAVMLAVAKSENGESMEGEKIRGCPEIL